ncbi:CDP-glucose 4,6-dehydratase [Pleomorphomonas sp. JP5]|uniref:CDP-glucose 4,6-dehydratase n=1 Tax=Pleomorphomonas sp. JP5 TaxID=2942998 RepID=UPI0038621992
MLTGQTGFKGAWCALWLAELGAEVTALALPPEEGPCLYREAGVDLVCDSHFADLGDAASVTEIVRQSQPQIVLHMAAQALVRRSMRAPETTWRTNVMGTLNLLNALRDLPGLEAVLVVTSDKVYANDGRGRSFREADPLGGKDPYSASKAACDILVHSMAQSYFPSTPVATVRGGNVIGGGDFSEDRLVPDCVRAVVSGTPIVLRQPKSTRPWQHVLDCLCGYLLYAEALATRHGTPRTMNIGPESAHDLPVLAFAEQLLAEMGRPELLSIREETSSIEAAKLALDPSQARETLGWRDRLVGTAAIDATARWYQAWHAGEDMNKLTRQEIKAYQGLE